MRRLGLVVSVLLICTSARADTPASTPLVTVGVESQLSRFGTSYETIYQLNLKPSALLRYGAVDAGVILPVGTGGSFPGYCCRRTLGNATALMSYRMVGQRWRAWSTLSVSAPSSQLTDSYGYTSRLAATAALLSDAGYFMPETTTVRMELGQSFAATRRRDRGAVARAHVWLRGDALADQVVLPLLALANLDLGGGFAARLTSRNQVALLDDALDERWLHTVEAAGIYQWASSQLAASLSVPLDPSLLALGLIALGIDYGWSF